MPDKIAVVTPTIGRYVELRRLLESLARQTCPPEQVVTVGDGEGNTALALEFPQLGAEFLPLPGASVSEKRNRGAEAVRAGIDFIAFIDDDMVPEPTALETVMRFWDAAPLANAPSRSMIGTTSRIESSRLTRRRARAGVRRPVSGAGERRGTERRGRAGARRQAPGAKWSFCLLLFHHRDYMHLLFGRLDEHGAAFRSRPVARPAAPATLSRQTEALARSPE